MATAALAPVASIEDVRPRRRSALAIFLSSPAAASGAIVVALVAVAALAAPLIAPHDPNAQDLAQNALPPAWLAGGKGAFALGTDHLGRDLLSRILWGARVSFAVGLSVVLIGGSIGVMLGVVAGFYGKVVDEVITRVADVQLAFPFVLLAVAIVGVLGPNLRNIIFVLGVTSWVQYVRVVRAETLSLRERDFVQAALAAGATQARVMVRHILPNLASSVSVLATFEVARAVILESALSFLGLGVSPGTPSWGTMLADGRQFLDTAWWMGTFPGIAIVVTVLGVNLLGDGLRDALDPHRA